MIDYEGASGFKLFKKTAGEEEDFQEQSGISNKTLVSLVTVAVIIVLCIIYGFQLRRAVARDRCGIDHGRDSDSRADRRDSSGRRSDGRSGGDFSY